MTPFRPTETVEYSRCPTLWYLRHVEGWQRPRAKWSPEMLMGSALHAGMAAYWRRPQTLRAGLGPAPDPGEMAQAYLIGNWPLDAPEEFSRDGHVDLLAKVMAQLLKWTSIHMAEVEPVMVETPLEGGTTTPDLVGREPIGYVLNDYKYHHSVKPEYIIYRTEGIERSHQFRHYAWKLGELGYPIALVRAIHVIGMPKIKVEPAQYTPNPRSQALWLAGARQKWYEMEKLKNSGQGLHLGLTRREEGCLQFGANRPCDMYDACWTCDLDREEMTRFYQREER